MWINSIVLQNIKCYERAVLKLSRGVNLLVGPNNAGKSTILQAVLDMQQKLPDLTLAHLRKRSQSGQVNIEFVGDTQRFLRQKNAARLQIHVDSSKGLSRTLIGKQGNSQWQPISSVETKSFIRPFLSRRKVQAFGETINLSVLQSIESNLSNLHAKVDRLATPGTEPGHGIYKRACKEILGFFVTTAASAGGKMACYVVHNEDHIVLDHLGEGVSNLLGMIVDLAMAKDELFVMEEPENDIHPKALKGLLRLIAEKAVDNQFLITTHSHIVLKQLGAAPDAKIFEVRISYPDHIPTATVDEVPSSPDARLAILQNLGYELFDSDLWQAWLFLEEASAEKIIREYLMPWFTPELSGRLRTFSARCVDEVVPKLEDFNRLFVYLHLQQEIYKNMVWVLIDGGESESEVIEELKQTYVEDNGWAEDRFRQLSEHDFERYYPQDFAADVEKVLSEDNKAKRQEEKQDLLNRVEQWIAQDKERAKGGFEESAGEVIGILKEIERAVCQERSARVTTSTETTSQRPEVEVMRLSERVHEPAETVDTGDVG